MKDSPIKAAFVASQEAGSFILRGEHIASQRSNWRAQIGGANLHDADVIVVVKRYDDALLKALQKAGKPVILDATDCWQSPDDAHFMNSRDGALTLLRNRWKTVGAGALVCCTEAQLLDARSFGIPAVHIPVHVQPETPKNEVREKIRFLGYQGEAPYLGEWFDVFETVAKQIGARFILNPPNLTSIDLIVSARAKLHRCYMSDHWKIEPKAADCIGSGTPALFMDEAGAREVAGSGARYFLTFQHLQDEMNALLDVNERRRMAEAGLSRAQGYTLESIADRYERFFLSLGLKPRAPVMVGGIDLDDPKPIIADGEVKFSFGETAA